VKEKPGQSKIQDGGLRYKTKAAGSMFGAALSNSLSCIKCGLHKPRTVMKPVRLLGVNYYRCTEECKPPKPKTDD
jgi:hypothetical protein